MVQLTTATSEQTDLVSPAVCAPPCGVTVGQLIHTPLPHPAMGYTPSPSSPLFPHRSESGSDMPGHDTLPMTPSTALTFTPPDPCLPLDGTGSTVHSHSFTSLGPIDTLPVSVLTFGSQNMPGDLSSDVMKTFEVTPVCGQSGDREAEKGPSHLSFSAGNSLHTDTRTDSVDSLIESRGYSSDSSDVYMNSDYTDTVTSTDSGAFLLSAKESDPQNADSTDSQCAESSPLISNFYSNEAFSAESRPQLIPWSSDGRVEESMEEEGAAESGSALQQWGVSGLGVDEDSGTMADREDEPEEAEDGKFIAPQENSALENLVNHLAEQHPQEVVDIRIEVLDQAVYPSLTAPLVLEQAVYPSLTEPLEGEASWLQSTDSLHHYKLLKQGRSSTTSNLRIHALSNLRANTMHNLHERSSFLNLTAASVSNLGNACQKALSYVRADMEFGSMMSLGGNAFSSSLLPGKQPPPQDLSEFTAGKKGGQAAVASGCHTRNVLYLALVVTVLLIAVNTTRNLQSSLNQEGGVGIICLAVMFASYTLGSLLSPVLVQGQGVKVCIVWGLLLQLTYVAANTYPVMWLMLPASLGGGASLALIWNAMSTYIVLLARGESDYKQKSYQRVSDKYFGIFCLVYQSNLIIGNLIASLVLTFAGGEEGSSSVLVNGSDANSSWSTLSSVVSTPLTPVGQLDTGRLDGGVGEVLANSSLDVERPFDALSDSHYHLCGAEYCHHFVLDQESSAVPQRTVYLLFGIFMFLVVGAILIAAFLLEPLSPRPFSPSTSPWHNIKRQILSLVKFSRNAKFLLLLPLLLYSNMQFSFVCSEVMMAYVTCPAGVWLVGYTMIGYGVSCSLGSYATQALVPRLGRGVFIGVVLENIRVLV